jgi:hypothetical protein
VTAPIRHASPSPHEFPLCVDMPISRLDRRRALSRKAVRVSDTLKYKISRAIQSNTLDTAGRLDETPSHAIESHLRKPSKPTE